MQKTTNYNLPQWEATDAVKREDVNGAMATVDAALKTVADAAAGGVKIKTGTYTGSGDGWQNISLGAQPKAVFVQSQDAYNGNIAERYSGFALPGCPVVINNEEGLAVTSDGFRARHYFGSAAWGVYFNTSMVVYYYVAIF